MRKIIVNEEQFNRFINEMTYAEITDEANNADTNPTYPQKEASNYKMGHISVKGMRISIENPKGSYRKYKNEDGTEGKNLMHHHYGYFNVTKGKDGDAVDCFIGKGIENMDKVYCIDQNNEEGEFDETKVMLGFSSKKEAKAAYLSNYSPDWKGFRSITCVPLKTFKKWLYRGRKQRQPFADYVEMKKRAINENIVPEEGYAEERKICSARSEEEARYIAKLMKREYGHNVYVKGNDLYAALDRDYLSDEVDENEWEDIRQAAAELIYQDAYQLYEDDEKKNLGI